MRWVLALPWRLTVLCCLAATAFAHGPAPSALEPLGAEASWIRLNIGYAQARADGLFDYVCPTQWGEEDVIALSAVASDGTIVIASGGIIYKGDGCSFETTAMPQWAAQSVSAVKSMADGVLVVGRTARDSHAWVVGDTVDAPVRIAGAVDSVVIDGATPWFIGARPEPFIQQGLNGEMTRLALPVDAQFLALKWVTGDRLFVTAATASGPVLLESEDAGAHWIERARGRTSIHGPVPFADGWLAVVDGLLASRGVAGDFVKSAEAHWTCLYRVEAVVYACVDRGLSKISGDAIAPDLEPVFTLDALLGPRRGCPPDAEGAETCGGQWLHFASESGLYRDDAAVDAPIDASLDAGIDGDGSAGDGALSGDVADGGGGCSQGGAGSNTWPLLLLLFAPWTRRSKGAL